MDFIAKNLKKAGIVNLILLIISLVLSVYRFIDLSPNILTVIRDIVYLFTVISGFHYAFSGYRKDSAKYYKLFMLLFTVFTLMTVAADIVDMGSLQLLLLRIVMAVSAIALTFVKDFGEKNSVFAAAVLLIAQFIAFFTKLSYYQGEFRHTASAFMHLALTCLVSVFVVAKYNDKHRRKTR